MTWVVILHPHHVDVSEDFHDDEVDLSDEWRDWQTDDTEVEGDDETEEIVRKKKEGKRSR